MRIETVSDFRQALRYGPWAWPGGYPIYFVTSDGEALSFEAAKAERRNIAWSIGTNQNDGWRVIASDINWEGEITCAHTGKPIEAAYDAE